MRELYQVIMDNERFYYTSGDSDFTLNNELYKAVSIYRNELSRDSLSDEAKLIADLDLAPFDLYKEFNPNTSIFVRILKENGALLFAGKVRSVDFELSKGTATIKLSAIGGVLNSKIPNRTYAKECGFNLFDDGCGLDKAKFSVVLANNFSISEDKLEITSEALASKPEGYFSGGYARFSNQHSYISEHTGEKITLMFPLKNLSTSDVLSVYAGCDKTIKMCKNKFGNSVNYGGFPFIPSKNPVTQGF